MKPPSDEAAAVAPISVYWEIKKCPVPDGYDARRLGPRISGFLRKLGYSGPITITAVGVLSKVPEKILEAVSSTGITLYNGPYGRKDMVGRIISHSSQDNIMIPNWFSEVVAVEANVESPLDKATSMASEDDLKTSGDE